MKKTLSALFVGAVMMLGAGSAWAQPKYGEGSLANDPRNFDAVTRDGQTGRLIILDGTIKGENFEPGTCGDGAPKCFIFTKTEPVPPFYFKRAHPGQTAFTVCDPCTVDGRWGGFILKISYPNPKSFVTEGASPFTKFTIQEAWGGLTGLKGQGTLDFSNGFYTMQYQFVP